MLHARQAHTHKLPAGTHSPAHALTHASLCAAPPTCKTRARAASEPRPAQLLRARAGRGWPWGGGSGADSRAHPPRGLRPFGDRGVDSSRVGGPARPRMRTGPSRWCSPRGLDGNLGAPAARPGCSGLHQARPLPYPPSILYGASPDANHSPPLPIPGAYPPGFLQAVKGRTWDVHLSPTATLAARGGCGEGVERAESSFSGRLRSLPTPNAWQRRALLESCRSELQLEENDSGLHLELMGG